MSAETWTRKSRHAQLMAQFCNKHDLRWSIAPPNGSGHPVFIVTWQGETLKLPFPATPSDNYRGPLNARRDLKRRLREVGWEPVFKSLDDMQKLFEEEKEEAVEEVAVADHPPEISPTTDTINGVIVDKATGLPVKGQGLYHPGRCAPGSPQDTYNALRRAYVMKRLKQGAPPVEVTREVEAVSDPLGGSTMTRWRRELEAAEAPHPAPTPVPPAAPAPPKPRDIPQDLGALNEMIDELIATSASLEDALSRGYAIYTRVTLAIGKWQTAEALAKASEAERQLAEIKRMLSIGGSAHLGRSC